MSLEKMDNNPDFAKMQEGILKFWEEDKTFEKSVNKNREKENTDGRLHLLQDPPGGDPLEEGL